jgi:signal transduction histidine kinase
MLEQATSDVSAVLADVRRLVHDLRPPALDELGLVRAIEQVARRLEGPDLTVSLVDDGLDGVVLPAAVEVAAFRIVSEAVNNVVRHSGARRCTVRLSYTDAVPYVPTHALVVEVRDDGRGIPDDVAAGVGMLSLRERAAELGGTVSVECPSGGGTVVRAVLPCGPSAGTATASTTAPTAAAATTGMPTGPAGPTTTGASADAR